MGSLGGGAPGGAPAGDGAAQGEAQEAAPEVVEKDYFDIELTGFDPPKKLLLIKELRAILGTGIKETKEMVETAPNWIKKEVKKDEAKEIVEKLESLGGTLRMA